jgi:protease YdgD
MTLRTFIASAMSCLAMVAGSPALAQGREARIRVDPGQPPWRAVGKLQATAGSLRTTCTAVLVAPRQALTAAHCLFNVRTQRNFLPSSLHVLLGFEGQRFDAAVAVADFVTGPGFDYNEPVRTRRSDWAVLTLVVPLGTPERLLPVADRLPVAGTMATIGGYGRDNPNVLTADLDCRVLGQESGLLRHDCAAIQGVSGAPLLAWMDGRWRVAGINVAMSTIRTMGLAVALDSEWRRQWLASKD